MEYTYEGSKMKTKYTEDEKERAYEIYKDCRARYSLSQDYTPKEAFMKSLVHYYGFSEKEANSMYSYANNRFYSEYREGEYCEFPL